MAEALLTPDATEAQSVEQQAADAAAAQTDAPADSEQQADGGEEQTAPELVEVEFEGKTYLVPPDVKDGLMRTADYTKKTTEVSEQRKTLETQQQEFRRAQQLHQELIGDVAQAVALQQQLDAYSKVDWQAFSQSDPVQAQQLWMSYQQLKDAHGKQVQTIQQKEQERAFQVQQETAKRLEEGHKILAKEIPGWSADKARELATFATQKLGFTAQEVAQVTDPRVVKLLHKALIADQLEAKMKGKPPTAPTPIRPVTQVGGQSRAVRNPDDLPIDEWRARREEELRKKRA